MASKIFASLLLCTLFFHAQADIVNPGDVKLQFMFTNLDKYPGFTYYYLHRGYQYNMGWKANAPDTSLVENNQRYTVSERGNSKSLLMALHMNNSKSKYLISDLELGGRASVDPTINGIVEVYTIINMDNGLIQLKKVKEIVQYNNGKEEERKSGIAWMGFIRNDKFNKGLTLISTCSLLALLLVFLFKKRKPKYLQLAT